MGKFDGVLLVSDFDGTFRARGGLIHTDNLRALEYFRSEGGRFTFATGRTPVTIGSYPQTLGINAPVILFNGGGLYDYAAGKRLAHITLPPEAQEDLAGLCAAMPSLAVEVWQWIELYAFRPNEVTDRHMKAVGASYNTRPIEQMPLPWTKIIVQQDHDTLLQARRWMEARGWGSRYELVFSNPFFLELVAKGCSKGATVKRLAELLAVPPERVYCVGDSENDMSMLAVSAIPFAPENCSEVVRASGARIVRACDQGAVAHVVEILDGIY